MVTTCVGHDLGSNTLEVIILLSRTPPQLVVFSLLLKISKAPDPELLAVVLLDKVRKMWSSNRFALGQVDELTSES